MSTQTKLGLIGFGCVGQGTYDILQRRPELNVEIPKIAVKQTGKKRGLDDRFFTTIPEELILDDEINTIAELIDDADRAFELTTSALLNGKDVISANKKMIATHFQELVSLQERTGRKFLYEASSCGSIPVIRTLENHFANERIASLKGIFNGSSNFILTKLANGEGSFEEILKEAQELGFAETDPTLDIEGYDASYKLVILTAHAFGLIVKPENVIRFGISNITEGDIAFASNHNLRIKQVAQAKLTDKNELVLSVMPQFVLPEDQLYHVNYEFNAVQIDPVDADAQFLYGKGAGSLPTGSAVVADVAALQRGEHYHYSKLKNAPAGLTANENVQVEVYIGYENEADLYDLPLDKVTYINELGDRKYLVAEIPARELVALSKAETQNSLFIAATGNVSKLEQLSLKNISRVA